MEGATHSGTAANDSARFQLFNGSSHLPLAGLHTSAFDGWVNQQSDGAQQQQKQRLQSVSRNFPLLVCIEREKSEKERVVGESKKKEQREIYGETTV